MKHISKESWKTKDGKTMFISEMTDQHLLNAIAYVKRRAKEGVNVVFNLGYANDNDYMEYEEYTIYGKEVTDHFGLPDLLKEKRYRKLK